MPPRKVPFSGKKKKEQLKERKARRAAAKADGGASRVRSKKLNDLGGATASTASTDGSSKSRRKGWLNSLFARESDEELRELRADSLMPLNLSKRRNPWDDVTHLNLLDQDVDIPTRPYPIKASKAQLVDEKKRFDQWKRHIEKTYEASRFNFCELNLDVWRQLWRCIERSHMVMIVADARFPLFHFPTALYKYLKQLKKPVFVVLNKVDLVPETVLTAWETFFVDEYPDIEVLRYSAFPEGQKQNKDAKGSLKYDGGEYRTALLAAARRVAPECPPPVWEYEDGDDHRSDKAKNDKRIYVGLVGYPNAGKSSLINGLAQRKLVSTSATPGHTKHVQTIELSDDAGAPVTLVDSPGLVFPAVDRPRALQILCGAYPIAQARSPFGAIRLLAEALPLETIYGVANVRTTSRSDDEDDNDARKKHKGRNADDSDDGKPLSPFLLCEKIAVKRGFVVGRNGRPDARRAAIMILKDARDGRLSVVWPPAGTTLSTSNNTALLEALDDGSGDGSELAEEFNKLNLSEDDTEDSTNAIHKPSSDTLATPVGSRREKRSTDTPIRGMLGRAVSRQTGNLSEDGRVVAPSEDDAEQAIDSGSGDIEGLPQERRRLRKQRKNGLADFYRQSAERNALGFLDDDDEGEGGGSSDDELDDGSAAASGSTGVILRRRSKRKGKHRKSNLALSRTDAGSNAISSSSIIDSAEEAEDD